MTQGHPEELVRLPGGLYWEELEKQEDDLAPYKKVDKRFIIQAYADHGVTDLLDMTASCIVPDPGWKMLVVSGKTMGIRRSK